jgi:anti-sigma factor RsiW
MPQLVLRHPGRSLVMPVQHLSATEIASFIDATLSPDARATAESHLSECPRCREELTSCLRLASTVPGQRRWRTSGPLIGAVAAAILVVAVIVPNLRRQRPEAIRERTSPLTPARTVVIAPRGDATVDGRNLRFVWHAQTDAVSYRVAMSDSTGAPVWSQDVSDTVAIPPASVSRRPGMRYYWRVDVLHADGSSDALGTTAFRIAP